MYKTKCVIILSGDYCSFGEMYLNVSYVFGDTDIQGDFLEIVDAPINIDDLPKKEIDNYVKKWLQENNDSDMKIFDCLVDENGKVWVDLLDV